MGGLYQGNLFGYLKDSIEQAVMGDDHGGMTHDLSVGKFLGDILMVVQ
jgi:hypothetical protein